MDEHDFCSVWEAQDQALLLATSLATSAFEVDFQDSKKAWQPKFIMEDFAKTYLPMISFPVPHLPEPCNTEQSLNRQLAVGPQFSSESQHVSGSDAPSVIRDRSRSPALRTMPAWVQHLWRLLVEEGNTEEDEEGPVLYVNSYYISHLTNRRQIGGRPIRFNSQYMDWQREFPLVWQDLFDPGRPFEVILVAPESPVTVMRDTTSTILIIQHPDEYRAACVTTAWIPDVPDFRAIEIAHSMDTAIQQRHLLLHAEVLDLCDHRAERGFGICQIRVGRYVYPEEREVRIHDGLRLLIEVPPPMAQEDWESHLADRIRLQAAPEPHFTDEENDAPTDETTLMARSPVPHLNGHGDSNLPMSSPSSSTSSSHSQAASIAGEPWILAIVFSLDRQEIEIEVPSNDEPELLRRTA